MEKNTCSAICREIFRKNLQKWFLQSSRLILKRTFFKGKIYIENILKIEFIPMSFFHFFAVFYKKYSDLLQVVFQCKKYSEITAGNGTQRKTVIFTADIFASSVHIINECLSYKFHPYSILTGHTKFESVAY